MFNEGEHYGFVFAPSSSPPLYCLLQVGTQQVSAERTNEGTQELKIEMKWIQLNMESCHLRPFFIKQKEIFSPYGGSFLLAVVKLFLLLS